MQHGLPFHTGEASYHVKQHCLECFSILWIPHNIKTDNTPTYTGKSFHQFCAIWDIQHITGISYIPQGQTIVECMNGILKKQLLKQKRGIDTESPHSQLHMDLLTLNFFTFLDDGYAPFERHSQKTVQSLKTLPLIMWKHPESGQWRGPNKLQTWGHGYGCIQESDNLDCVWVPERNIKPYNGRRSNPGHEETVPNVAEQSAPKVPLLSTQKSSPIKWSQLKKTTKEAWEQLEILGQPQTPATLLLMITAIINCTVCFAHAEQYWVYILEHAIAHPVTWFDVPPTIYFSDTAWMPGTLLSKGPDDIYEYNYTGLTSRHLLCVAKINSACHCLSSQAWLAYVPHHVEIIALLKFIKL
jgi:hypothetical protein